MQKKTKVILFILGVLVGILSMNMIKDRYFSIEEKNKKEEVPKDYIAVFHSEDGDIMYETYIYKMENGQENYGFHYVNVTKTCIENNEWNTEITKQGLVSWTENVFEVAKENGAYFYVTQPSSDKKYTIKEFQQMFLMD